VLALLRLVEPEEESIIEIDGVDIQQISLHTLRSNVTVIPQDPVMFSGTLRANLDPFDQFSDEDIWESLARAHLKEDIISKFPEKLGHVVSSYAFVHFIAFSVTYIV
jgi:ABC-type multidrug transport system fused ATPase/permease subunit